MSFSNGSNWEYLSEGLSGDIGSNIYPGKGKKIVFDPLMSRDKLVGNDVIFKVEARMNAAPVTTTPTYSSNSSSRKRSYDWSDDLDFDGDFSLDFGTYQCDLSSSSSSFNVDGTSKMTGLGLEYIAKFDNNLGMSISGYYAEGDFTSTNKQYKTTDFNYYTLMYGLVLDVDLSSQLFFRMNASYGFGFGTFSGSGPGGVSFDGSSEVYYSLKFYGSAIFRLSEDFAISGKIGYIPFCDYDVKNSSSTYGSTTTVSMSQMPIAFGLHLML
jgi:hypothetical protein